MEHIINGDGANRAARRLAQQAMAKRLHTIAILERQENGETVYRWGGNNGVWFSPAFTSLEDAFRYPEVSGLTKVTEEVE